MKPWACSTGVALLALAGAVSGQMMAQETDAGKTSEIGRTTENELNVVLSSSFGSVAIGRGEPEKICVVENSSATDHNPKLDVQYTIRNRVGFLDLSLGKDAIDDDRKKTSFNIHELSGGNWSLQFTDAVPISFDVELGVGKGDFDLSGLAVKDFNLSTGASDVTLSFDEPNKSVIENMNIESGVSKFEGRNLGNANFRRFKFQGGVGTYKLDFSGDLANEVDVDVELGLGILTIIVPANVGATVTYQKSWVSHLDCSNDFHETGETSYASDNYPHARGRMNISIDSGIGSVKIRRP